MKIDKNVVMLGIVSFFTDMASAMINPILPIFVVSILHEGMDKLGIVVAVATFVSYALRLISGYISDRFSIVKPLVVAGYAISAFSKPLIGFSHGYKSVAALRALERLGKALRSAPKDRMIAYYSKKSKEGKTFGFHKTLDIAGELAGSVLLFLVLLYFGSSEEVVRNVFYSTLIPGVLALLIVIFFVKDIKKEKNKRENFKLSLNDKKVIKGLLPYFFFIFFIFSDAFFTMQAKEVGIEVSLIPLLFILSTLTQTLTSYFFGVLTDRAGVWRVLLFSYITGIISLVFLRMQAPVYTWIAFLFLGLFTVSSLNANRAYIAKYSDNKASVYGVFYAMSAVFSALGAYIIGFIWHERGMALALDFSLVGSFAALLLFFVIGFRDGGS
ncbi:MAG: MFS transporter [Epsilonproteobacteria bacterium]|nr:MFS transporter [Campylobacterota bacterium]